MAGIDRRRLLGALGGVGPLGKAGWAHAQTPEAPAPARPVPLVSLARLPERVFSGAQDFESAWISTLSYDSPFRPDADGTPGSGVVFTSVLSDDGLQLDLFLRTNVFFQDGTPLTVDDLVASIQLARSRTSEPWRFRNLVSVERLNRTAARLTLSQPDVTIPYTLSSPSVPVIPAVWVGRENGLQPPPGTGPFQYIATDEERWIYRPHPEYWSVLSPKVLGLELLAGDDTEERVAQLLTDQVDLLVNAPVLDMPTFQQDPDRIRLAGVSQNQLCYLEVNAQSANLSDSKVRVALASGINRSLLVDGALAGFGTPCERLFPVGHWAAGEAVPTIEQSAEQVRQALRDLDILPGMPLVMVAPDDDPVQATTCVLLQEQLAYAGFAVSLNLLTGEELASVTNVGTYDLRLALSPFWRDPQELAYPLLASDGESNLGGFSNTRIDLFLERAVWHQYLDYRAERYQAVQEVLNQVMPIIPLYTPRYVDAHLTRLANYPEIMPVSALGCAQMTLVDADPAAT